MSVQVLGLLFPTAMRTPCRALAVFAEQRLALRNAQMAWSVLP
jgi:hypothetical protein